MPELSQILLSSNDVNYGSNVLNTKMMGFQIDVIDSKKSELWFLILQTFVYFLVLMEIW